MVGVFGVDRRQRDERPAVARPARHLRELGERRFVGEHRARAHPPRQHGEGIQRRSPVAPGGAKRGLGVDLQLHEPLHAVEGVGKDPLDSRSGAVEIDEDGERCSLDLREQHRRATRAEQPPLDLGDLQMGIDGVIDPHQMPLGLQGRDTLLE